MRRKLPIVTLLLAGLALVIWAIPEAARCFLLERSRLIPGEWWRLWTGHWVHFSVSHLVWDVLVFVLCGSFVELRNRRWFALILLITPLIIGPAVLLFAPTLNAYGGLSGITTALMAYAGLVLAGLDRWRAFGALVLTALAFKLISDALGFHSTFVSFSGNVRPEPISHFAGAFSGGMAWLIERAHQDSGVIRRQKLC